MDLPLKERIHIRFTALRIALYGRLVPFLFLEENSRASNSALFRRYLALILSLAQLIKSIRALPPSARKYFVMMRLRRLMRFVRKSPWWWEYLRAHNMHTLDLSVPEHFKKIPPTSPTHFAGVPRSHIATGSIDAAHAVLRRASGGLSGRPFQWYLDRRIIAADMAAHYVALLEEQGYDVKSRGEKQFVIRFNCRGGENRGILPHFTKDITVTHKDPTSQDIERLVHALEEASGAVIITSPSEIVFLAQLVEDREIRTPIALALVTGGAMHDNERHETSKRLGCPIIQFYSIQEVGIAATECRRRSRHYHVHEERTFIEVLNEDGSSSPGEKGKITITALDNVLMPLLRYQPGTMGRLIPSDGCDCLQQSPLLAIEEERGPLIVLRHGETLPVREITRLLAQDPYFEAVQRMQIIERPNFHIDIVLAMNTPGMFKEVASLMKAQVEKMSGKNLSIAMHRVDFADYQNRGPVFTSLEKP